MSFLDVLMTNWPPCWGSQDGKLNVTMPEAALSEAQ